jgi:hypothetical protein
VPRTFPQRPDLEQLKTLARELQHAYNSGEPAARQRFALHLPAALSRQFLTKGRRQAPLAQAQTVLAREYGFSSWPRLRQHVEQMRAALHLSVESRSSPSRAAHKERITLLAERLASEAEAHNLEAFFAALRIGQREGDEVRALLVEQGRFTVIVDALLTGVANSSARVRFLAAQALDHWADERCAAPLQALLNDAVPRVRWAALHSLRCDVCKLTPLVAESDLADTVITLARTDPSIKVRRVATWELGQLRPSPAAIAALEELCAHERDPIVLRNARLGLSRLQKAGAAQEAQRDYHR